MAEPLFRIAIEDRLYDLLAPLVPERYPPLPRGNLKDTALKHMRSSGHRTDLLVFATPQAIRNFSEAFPSVRSRRLRFAFVAWESDSALQDLNSLEGLEPLLDFRAGTVSPLEIEFILRRAESYFRQREESRYDEWQKLDHQEDQKSLITIGRALAFERDPESLLRSILFLSKKMTGADAGSIFLCENPPEGPLLRFKFSHTYSRELAYEEFTMAQSDQSIAGYVANHACVLNLANVNDPPPGSPWKFNSSFDQKSGYKTVSMLSVPMISPGGQVLGVLQLINCKEAFHLLDEFTGNEAYEVVLETPQDFHTKVVPFPPRYEALMEAVAAQAAIALENNRMYRQIQDQFEAFVQASVKAIEARDPPTSGHSFRVAETSRALALAVNRRAQDTQGIPRFSDDDVRQLFLAAQLHDFGKVYIDYSLFSKAKKLLPSDFLAQGLRWDLIHTSLMAMPPEGSDPQALLEELGLMREKALALAEPQVQHADPLAEVKALMDRSRILACRNPRGEELPFLTEEEAENLSIPRGSLNPRERKIIESHVVHSYEFVKNIPWPVELARIPEIIYMHHELLDGSGYPRGLKAEQIPVEARILTLSDIFDALSAADRPYKKALPIPRVLVILKEEADQGRLDRDLVDLFIQEELYKVTVKGDQKV